MAASNHLGLDANIDMLHQLMEEIEEDRKAVMDIDSNDTVAPRRVYSGNEHNPLDSIPEAAAVNFNNGVGVHDDDLVGLTELQGNSAVDSPASLILPYSDTSSDAESDSSEPPALPPRTWRKNDQQAPLSVSPIALGLGSAYATNPLNMKCTISDEDSLPSITVSPPRSRMYMGAMHESIEMVKECREEVDGIRRDQAINDSMTLKRFSTSCPSLEDQGMYDSNASSAAVMQPRQARGQYKSLLDVTQEENEDEVKAATAETLFNTHRPCGERPKSLDFSALGVKLSLAGVTGASSTTDVDDESFADRNRKVSFNMFGGGAQKEKTKFHQGVESAGKRSFSLGSLGSEDDEDEPRTRIRERSADSDGHVKPIDIYGAPLQKLPNVDFSKHMGQQSDGSTSSLHSSSQEQLNRQLLTVGNRHSQQVRSALPLPQTHVSTNLNKSKSVSTPSIHQAGDQAPSNRHSGLFHTSNSKAQHNTDSLRRAGPRRPLSHEQEQAGGSPSNYEDEEKKSKKGGRRTSVFAKFGSVRKTGKPKDKNEVKRANHNFIVVNLPNSTCNHCSRQLSYKPSVQCSNCLMNYHDECKDKVLSCPKQKRERKVPVVQSLTNQPNRHETSEGIMSPSIGDSYSPSMESLADDGNADDEYEDDPELAVASTEAESWSETIDKKVLKSYKVKYVQRQDNIWELIATEKQYCVNLKIMQKVFAHGMKNECMLPDSAISRIFPQLDELIDLHQSFLASLQDRQCKKPDKSVDVIGDVIVNHFGGTAGERMKRAYGIFCSRHKEGIDYYKQLYKADRKFQTFIKKVSNLSCTKRRGVQDLVTVVTMRMTKYKTLIENIIKNTKDSKDKADKETLHKALDLNKDILRHIDMSIHNRNQELRLLEIYNKMDARSTAVYDRIKKFKKSDLTAKNRKLRHEGVLSWRNAREKEVETLVVVLSDVMLLLQETDKKYSFFTQDNKPSVVPLTSLIVREKGATKDNRGIYLIRQSRENPEMYELVCKSSQERKEWIDLLRKAVNECPEEDEGVINETEEEHKQVIAKLGKLREYVETLDYKDKELEKCCRERFSIIADIMQVYDYTDVLQNVKSCYDDNDELKSAGELIKLSLDEASMLASLYQTVPSSTNLGRSWSSVGERHSPTYQQIPLPKRAETFNGFDQDVKSPAATNRPLVDRGDAEGRTPSLLNLHQDSDCEGTPDSNTRTETTRSVSVNRRSSSNILQQLLNTTSSSSRHDEAESCNDSLLATSNMLAITAIIPPSKEQAQCVAQLNEYLHGILLVINKQDSVLEHTKQQLADLTVRSRRIEQEQEKKSALRHNKQMEEIRNRHEQLTKERASLEAEKESLNEKLEKERAEMDFFKEDMANQQSELKREREELQRQKEALQKQVDFYHQARGYPVGEHASGSPSRTPHLSPQSSSADLDVSDSPVNSTTVETEVGHKRSHSADLIDNAQMFMDSRYSASLTEPLNMKEMRAQHLANSSTSPDRQAKTNSAGNLTKMDRNSSQGSLKKTSNNNTVQQIPSKLVSGQTSKTSTASNAKSMLPLNLAESSKKGAKNSKEHSAKTPGQGKKNDVIYF